MQVAQKMVAIAALAGAAFVATTTGPPQPVPMPQPRPEQAEPAPIAQPHRSLEHRKVHKIAPKVAHKAKPRLAPKAKRHQRVASIQQRKPTANECAQMSSGVSLLGRDGVKAGGRLRGHSDAQIERALRDCGL